MTAWIAVLCIGVGSLAFRLAPLAFADRGASPKASRLIKDAGAAAVAAITVAAFDRAAQVGESLPLAVAGAVSLVLAVKGASMLRIVAVGVGLYVALSVALSALV